MATDITTDRLRELAETRSAVGKVLSVFINLDPREFATPSARSTEISSVLDEASRTIRDLEGLTHDERAALKADVERVSAALTNGTDLEGARALAVFASEPAGLFEILKLPRPVDHSVSIGDTPRVEPLARIGTGELWWLVLVDRQHARLLAGSVDGVVELWRHEDDPRARIDSGKSDQDGRSERRYERSVEKEVDNHLRGAANEVARRLRHVRVAGILVGGPRETASHFKDLVPAEVGKALKGRFDVEVWTSSADDVLKAASGVLEEVTAARDGELLDKVDAGVGTGGRAVSGLSDVLAAVHERRIDTLVIEEGFTAKGVRCPQCGWLGVSAGGQCPADGTMTEMVDNVVEAAVGRAFGQDARVRYLPAGEDATRPVPESIAAVLRF
ncbi:baeRF10 domain-containing protein [Baekduia sp. Peel2402]|uniref:baeRF10 domain-containing protein n=1 Tax=Baekduia sp. Peel2402 TaxID=3458296 RepID=UPI00403E522B